MAAVMPMTVDVKPSVLDAIPRLRWSPKNHRFHYNMPFAAEPGERGFVLLQEFETADSYGTWVLPDHERHHLEEMERVNKLIEDVEVAAHLQDTIRSQAQKRVHHEEYHSHDVTDGALQTKTTKKKDTLRTKLSPKQIHASRKRRPTRSGSIQQPR